MVFYDIMEILVKEDWLEILAEDQLSYSRLDEMWKILPPLVQSTIYKTERPKIIMRITEDIYFGILNEVVGNLWVGSIVNYVIGDTKGGDDILEIIMPLQERRRTEKRNTKFQ